jgi:signal transduction histidine kinase
VRRSLIATVAASVTVVLLAMLVPMAVLVRDYSLEDRLSRAALEVQATETVVSGQDKGAVATYLSRINRRGDSRTTVLYPGGPAVGPDPGEDARVREARTSGRARVDDVAGGSQILVPVSQGGSSALPAQTPVIRVIVDDPGLASGVQRAWLVLLGLGALLLLASLVLADRLGRSFVEPIRRLAVHTRSLGGPAASAPPAASGPPEVRELSEAVTRLVARIELLLAREREAVSDLSHRLRTPVTALRLRLETVADAADRERLSGDVDELEAMVDHVIREARRSEREGVDPDSDAVEVLAQRVRFWMPFAEDQGRELRLDLPTEGSSRVRAAADDLTAVADALLDNAFSHTPDGTAIHVRLGRLDDGSVELVVDDAGPGYPAGTDVAARGSSGVGSTGLGLAIVARTARESGGGLTLARAPLGGARARVVLGPR